MCRLQSAIHQGTLFQGSPKQNQRYLSWKTPLSLSSATWGFNYMVPIRLDGWHGANGSVKCLLKVFHWAKLQGNHRAKNMNAVWLKPLAGNLIVLVALWAPKHAHTVHSCFLSGCTKGVSCTLWHLIFWWPLAEFEECFHVVQLPDNAHLLWLH